MEGIWDKEKGDYTFSGQPTPYNMGSFDYWGEMIYIHILHYILITDIFWNSLFRPWYNLIL